MSATYRPATATVIASYLDGDTLHTTLRIEGTGLSYPLAPASLFNITEVPESKYEKIVDLHRASSRHGNEVTFQTYGATSNPLSPGEKYHFQQWWADWQHEIAHTHIIEWRKEEFKPSDAILFRLKDGSSMTRKLEPGENVRGKSIVPGGWEHAHCSLCWKAISTYPEDQHTGYVKEDSLLCEECFSKYIQSGFGKRLGDCTRHN